MQSNTHHRLEANDAERGPHFVSLDREARTAVETACAAHHLTRRPQTLRGWACREDGPIRPIRINGRLAWSVADLRRLLGGK